MKDKSVLIVDDMPSNVKLCGLLLKQEGYKIFGATDGHSALKIAKSNKPTLILLDIMMPVMDGYEVCQSLKSDSETKDIPVIFLTGKSDETEKLKGLNLGAVDYITKPFHQLELLARVRNHIELFVAKRSLFESEQKYSKLIENIHDGVFLWQEKNGIIFANPKLYEMTNHKKNKRGSLELKTIFSPNSLSGITSVLNGALSKGYNCCENNFTMLKGKSEEFHVTCVPALIEYLGEPTILVTVRDMTERMAFESRLTQSQKLEAIGSLTSGIVHDFNNILAIVNGYAELALLEIEPGTDLRRKVEVILSAGRGAISLTEGLLSFAREGELKTEVVDVYEELEVVKNFVGHSLPASIKLTVNPSSKKLYSNLDIGLFQQVIVNLCINARDALGKEGKIDISTEEVILSHDNHSLPDNITPGAYVRIDIADNGSGIPKEIVDKVFNPFFTTKDKGKGAGLGLAMVTRIVQDHGGWIDLKTTVGKGTTFKLYFPSVKSKKASDIKAIKYGVNEDCNPVLVVDDDKVQANMLKYYLETGGYDAQIATTASDALDILENAKEPFKLIIVDYIMPEKNGLELCKEIESLYPDMKILFTSGGGHIPAVGNKQLRKPFSSEVLLSSIAHL